MPQAKSDRKKAHAPYIPRLQGLEPKNQPKPPAQRTRQQKKQSDRKADNDDEASAPIDLSTTIPISLQQLLLDVFKTALFTRSPAAIQPTDSADLTTAATEPNNEQATTTEEAQLDTKTLVQTIKTHLYQRDFDSAFTDADDSLLRVYALRWSAARALGYAGIFKAVLKYMRAEGILNPNTRIVSIGGGAGAEIVALAAVWRDLHESVEGLGNRLEKVSLEGEETTVSKTASLDVAAVDIADWSSVIDRLEKTMRSSNVPTPSSSKHQPPLAGSDGSEGEIYVSFSRTDVLTVSESDLKDVLHGTGARAESSPSLLVTLMFTLNELFSTSMAKTTGLLLRMTEILPPGAVLLVVDSPGSYSTLKLGKGKDGVAQERNYPMKFLLDHTLLSVAEGKWERVLSQDSRWWRRDAARLRYEVGEGAGLEDMRFQLHLYKRLA
jgi:25S rRNA (uracil2843-N3)-methyltransferase